LGAVFASEGSGNVSVNYTTGVPCQSLGGVQVVCTPSAPGTYPVSAFASDMAGVNVSIGLSVVVVNPALGLTASAPTTPIPRGTPVVLGVSVDGGTPPFLVVFSDIPRGCASVNATTYRCDLQLPGTYSFAGTVTDAVGSVASAHVVVYVTTPDGVVGAPSSAPPSPPSGTDYVFWGLVLAAVVQIGLSIRYARRPSRRQWENAGRIRKGLWSVFGSAPTDAADAEPVPGADASA
jgi:hypothetical protein